MGKSKEWWEIEQLIFYQENQLVALHKHLDQPLPLGFPCFIPQGPPSWIAKQEAGFICDPVP